MANRAGTGHSPAQLSPWHPVFLFLIQENHGARTVADPGLVKATARWGHRRLSHLPRVMLGRDTMSHGLALGLSLSLSQEIWAEQAVCADGNLQVQAGQDWTHSAALFLCVQLQNKVSKRQTARVKGICSLQGLRSLEFSGVISNGKRENREPITGWHIREWWTPSPSPHFATLVADGIYWYYSPRFKAD